MSVRWSCLGALVITLGVPFGAPGARSAEKPVAPPAALAGRWKLNAELSEDAQAKLAKAGESRKDSQPKQEAPAADAERQGSGRGGGGHRGAGGGGGHGSVPAPDDDPRGPQKTDQPQSLTITQTELEVVIEEKPGQGRSLYPNGKTYKADEGASEVRTAWKEGALVSEKKNVRGWRLTETWRLDPDGKRLLVEQHLEGGSRPRVSIKRVYDRVEPSS